MEGKKAVIAGGRRITQKKRHNIVSNNHSKYLKNIKSCNSKIETMNDNDYLKFRDYSTKVIHEVCNEIRRDHFKDRDEFRKYKINKLKYLYSLLFYPKNDIKIIFKTDNYNFIDKTFNKDGLIIIDKIISLLENTIVERKYEPLDEESIYNKTVFDKYCRDLGLDPSNKLLFSTIKEAFNNKKELAGGNEESKENINKAFITIRNQYENYLKAQC